MMNLTLNELTGHRPRCKDFQSSLNPPSLDGGLFSLNDLIPFFNLKSRSSNAEHPTFSTKSNEIDYS